MKLKIKKLNEKAEVRRNGNVIDLVTNGINMEINPDASASFIHYSGISIEIPEGYIGIVTPNADISNKSYVMSAPSYIISGKVDEVTCKFKLITSSVPSFYNAGDVFARLIIIKDDQDLEYDVEEALKVEMVKDEVLDKPVEEAVEV